MNATPFANLEARLGRAMGARLSDGYLVPEGSVALAAIINNTAIDAALGAAGMQTRNVGANVSLADLADDVGPGTLCTVYRGDQRVLPEGLFEVLQRDDDVATGRSQLALQLAP